MFNIIGWILIGICCFYLIRNIIAGSILYPMGNRIIKIYNKWTAHEYEKISGCRNYYLFVLNPFWWHYLDVIPNTYNGKRLKQLWRTCNKEAKKLMKN